jgi:pimeloyl-ACP methyl ester carboxylesterase
LSFWPAQAYDAIQKYWIDAWQRSILFLDILRERGNIYREHSAKLVPNVLHFDVELVRDGRTLPRPVAYGLVRIKPPAGVVIDPGKPPFIVVDPRAGHGPGIGGMKPESEIGVAMAAGHACYFIGFRPTPEPGQTIEDVCLAQAAFVEEVAARHPDAEGKPVVIGNCQAGWQTAMMAAMRPDVAGPILLAGAPLSYWAGVRGKNPLRYKGGVMGGSCWTAFAGDLGQGLFDGAALVANFETMNPANTLWEKPYNVYSKADTEGARFLDFETWWGSPVLLNASEMQWIVDNLFIGDKLATGALRTSEGVRIDLRNIRSPIIVFCSWGDDITPPQQALGWITEIYDHEREIAANGQTIVYCLHHSVGHLGIFVSGKVATREHSEFASCMAMIDLAPAGLYEAVITDVGPDTARTDLIDGRYLFRLEPRTVDDVRAIVSDSPEDDLRFAACARVSDAGLALYRQLWQPMVRAMVTEPVAEAMRAMHPNRLRFAAFSDSNPLMAGVESLARAVRERRQPVSPDNPLRAAETHVSNAIGASLAAYGEARDAMTEIVFLNTYGSPLLQAAVGLGHADALRPRPVERDLVREADEAQRRLALEARFESGGAQEAALRALIYVSEPKNGFDERGFTMLKRMRAAQPAAGRIPVGELKAMIKEQSLLVRLDEERAIEAIPKLLPERPGQREPMLDALHEIIEAEGAPSEECRRRLARIDALFNGAGEAVV